MPPLTTTFTQQIPACNPYAPFQQSVANARRSNFETLPVGDGTIIPDCCKECGDWIGIGPTNPPFGVPSAFSTFGGVRVNGFSQNLSRTTTADPHEFLSPTFYLNCTKSPVVAGSHSGQLTPTGGANFTGSATGSAPGFGAYSISLTGTFSSPSSGTFTGTISGAITGTLSGSFPGPSDPLLPSTDYTISSPVLFPGSVVVGRSTYNPGAFTKFTGQITTRQKCYERATWSSCNKSGLLLEVFREADDVLLFTYLNKHHGVRCGSDALLLLDYFSCAACLDGVPQALCASMTITDDPAVP